MTSNKPYLDSPLKSSSGRDFLSLRSSDGSHISGLFLEGELLAKMETASGGPSIATF